MLWPACHMSVPSMRAAMRSGTAQLTGSERAMAPGRIADNAMPAIANAIRFFINSRFCSATDRDRAIMASMRLAAASMAADALSSIWRSAPRLLAATAAISRPRLSGVSVSAGFSDTRLAQPQTSWMRLSIASSVGA